MTDKKGSIWWTEEEYPTGLSVIVGILTLIMVIWLIILAIVFFTARESPQAGTMGVVRNGSSPALVTDWWDNHKIRGVIEEGSGSVYTGLGSDVHFYPASSQQRYFRLETCTNETGAEVPCPEADDTAIRVPTQDGVLVGIEGTIYLTTRFDNKPEGIALLKDFDTQFGTRTFGKDSKHAWEGNSGWKAYLASIVEPVVSNNFRETLANIPCAQLVSSCALVQNGTSGRINVDTTRIRNSVSFVQERINTGLITDLNKTLNGEYFTRVSFSLTKVDLPEEIQTAINGAQSAFTQVTQAQARLKSAEIDARANAVKQEGYQKCPTCATVDQLKAIPSNITVWAPGNPAGALFGR